MIVIIVGAGFAGLEGGRTERRGVCRQKTN